MTRPTREAVARMVFAHRTGWDGTKGLPIDIDYALADSLLAPVADAERVIIERCAKVLDEAREHLETQPPVLLGWTVTQSRIRLLRELAAAIRALQPEGGDDA